MRGFATNGQCAQAPNVTQKVLAVPLAVAGIDDQLSRLEELTSQLLSRIAPLISLVSIGEDESSTAKGLCEFAGVLEGKADRIKSVADRIGYALSSLEF